MIRICTPGQFRKRTRPGIPKEVFERAKHITEDVRKGGFAAVADYSLKLDGILVTEQNLKASQKDIMNASRLNAAFAHGQKGRKGHTKGPMAPASTITFSFPRGFLPQKKGPLATFFNDAV